MRNIPFAWGGDSVDTGMDCFTYASYVSELLCDRAFDLSKPPIVNAYCEFASLTEKPPDLLLRLADELGLERSTEIGPGTLLLISSPSGCCLATVLEDECLAFMGVERSHVLPLSAFDGKDIVAAFNPDGLRYTV